MPKKIKKSKGKIAKKTFKKIQPKSAFNEAAFVELIKRGKAKLFLIPSLSCNGFVSWIIFSFKLSMDWGYYLYRLRAFFANTGFMITGDGIPNPGGFMALGANQSNSRNIHRFGY